MKNKNTQVDLSEYVVFIPVENEDVLTGVSETLGDLGDDFNLIFGDDYIITTHDRKDEILGLIAELIDELSEDEDEE